MIERRVARTLVLVFASAAMLGGCASPAMDPLHSCAGAAWHETRLFLGRDMPGGGEVSEAMWRQFVESVVAPRLGDGFTVLDGSGFWFDGGSSTTEEERTKVLLVLHPQQASADAALEEISAAYLRRFDQQAVLRADRPLCVTFYGAPGTSP